MAMKYNIAANASPLILMLFEATLEVPAETKPTE
jgi:hypothetical protein